jgi:hypothetical protein
MQRRSRWSVLDGIQFSLPARRTRPLGHSLRVRGIERRRNRVPRNEARVCRRSNRVRPAPRLLRVPPACALTRRPRAAWTSFGSPRPFDRRLVRRSARPRVDFRLPAPQKCRNRVLPRADRTVTMTTPVNDPTLRPTEACYPSDDETLQCDDATRSSESRAATGAPSRDAPPEYCSVACSVGSSLICAGVGFGTGVVLSPTVVGAAAGAAIGLDCSLLSVVVCGQICAPERRSAE